MCHKNNGILIYSDRVFYVIKLFILLASVKYSVACTRINEGSSSSDVTVDVCKMTTFEDVQYQIWLCCYFCTVCLETRMG